MEDTGKIIMLRLVTVFTSFGLNITVSAKTEYRAVQMTFEREGPLFSKCVSLMTAIVLM